MKIGFIGGGRVVSWQLERISKFNNFEIGGIYDLDSNIRDFYREKGLKVFENLEQLVKSNLDVISICTPSDSHMNVFLEVSELCNKDQIITIEMK